MKKIHALLLIMIFLSCLWMWSQNGISSQLEVRKKGKTITVYFDKNLIGKAEERITEQRVLIPHFSYQDLNNQYFINTSRAEPDSILLNQRALFRIWNPFSVILEFKGDKTSYLFYFNPYRHLNSGWIDNQKILVNTHSYQVQIGLLNGIKWIVWLITKPIYIVFFVTVLIVLLFSFSKLTVVKKLHIGKKTYMSFFICSLFIITVSFLWSRLLMKTFTKEVPHVPDAVSYIVLGKLLSSGSAIIPFSSIPRFIPKNCYADLFYHWFTKRNDFFFVYYPLGHPLILAIGNLFHVMNLIPPLIGAGILFIVFLIIFKITHSVLFSFLGTITLFLSPFFQTQTIDYMSHNTAAFYILLALLPLFFDSKKWLPITGFFVGMLLNTRPLTFLACGIGIALYLFWISIKEKRGKYLIHSFIGFIPPVLLFFWYNNVTTGNIFHTPYEYHGILQKIGFGNEFKIGYGLLHTFTNLSVFSLYFLKNYYFSFLPLLFSFILLPFFGKTKPIVLLLLSEIGLIVGAWTFFDANAFMYGPRFIYEATPLFSILLGVSLFYLFEISKNKLYRGIIILLISFLFFQISYFELQWLGVKKPDFSGIAYVPSTIQELKGFNFSDDRYARLYNKTNGKTLFLMKKNANWWDWSGVWLNEYPLNKSKKIFLTEPKCDINTIKEKIIIDWNNI